MNLSALKFREPVIPASKILQSQIIREYQKNLKVFIKKVQSQVQKLIEKYESQLKMLRKQNILLKQKLDGYSFVNPEQLDLLKSKTFKDLSPIKKQMKQFRSFKDSSRSGLNFMPKSPEGQTNLGTQSIYFKSYLQFQKEDLSLSRFQSQKNKKKKHLENLLNSLEMGKNLIKTNKQKLCQLLGKNAKQKSSESQQQQQQVKSVSQNKSLNHSLSLVCQSLDNSFHGKKSKKKNQLKRKQKQKLRQQRLKQAQKYYKDRKQSGLKNLLKTIRQNVSVHINEERPLETLKSIKISNLNQENKEQQPNSAKKNGSSKTKVLIDPNPVDISNKKSFTQKDASQKKPHSILKKNSLILSKSILSNSLISN